MVRYANSQFPNVGGVQDQRAAGAAEQPNVPENKLSVDLIFTGFVPLPAIRGMS